MKILANNENQTIQNTFNNINAPTNNTDDYDDDDDDDI